ncbi:MAG TPA: hypothetical protein VJ063_19100, partial [Verrucomicrobiae bacterium]|nr:hypothetical protein [Verrucomicrobiae bacterium]
MVRHLVSVLVLAVAVCEGAEEQRFEYKEQGFAITLSSDWKEVDSKTAPYAKDVLSKDHDIV